MSILEKIKGVKKDKHGNRIIAEHQGPNRAQRRGGVRIDHGIPYYDKHPYATDRDAHLKAVESRKRRTRAKLDTPIEERQRHNAIMRTSYQLGHAERVERREARKQEAIKKQRARV